MARLLVPVTILYKDIDMHVASIWHPDCHPLHLGLKTELHASVLLARATPDCVCPGPVDNPMFHHVTDPCMHVQVSWQAIEEAFWNIVEEGEEDVEVLYGADLDSTIFGSAFPTKYGRMPESEYAEAPWNLNNIPRLPGTSSPHTSEQRDSNQDSCTVSFSYGILHSLCN